MANQFQRGTNIGTTVESAAQLHALVEGAKILPAAITDQTEADGLTANDFALVYHSASNAIRKVRIGSLVFTPGDVLPTAATSIGGAWLRCDGAQYLKNEYAALYAAIGDTYGAADTGYFRVPDLRGRVPAGLDTQVNGAYGGRLTNSGTGNPGVDGRTLGAAGGADRWKLITAELPAHAHGYLNWGINQDENGVGGGDTKRVTSAFSSTVDTGSAGSNYEHPNTQPTLILNFKIKT